MKVIISQSSNFTELQSQFSSPNCIYVIGIEQQTFGTFTSPLVIPENSTLIFEGGKFIGGYVKLNNTVQNDVYYRVWENVEISGTFEHYVWRIFKNEMIRPEWFGAVGDGINDDTQALQQAIKIASACGSVVKLSARRYLITKTVHIFSATHIEGTLPGSIDRNIQTGTSIEAKLTTDNIALDANASYEKNGVKVDPSGCYKFILRDFSIVNVNTNSGIGLRLYSKDDTCPRNGVIENVFVYSFATGLELNAFSYVKMSYMSITDCQTSIHIDPKGGYAEFIWFSNIYVNTNALNAVGIKIENGNNIYFNEIDINSCKYGFWANAVKSIYNLFVNKMNVTGCINSVWFYAKDQYIARVKMSEVSIYSFPNSEVGILFSRVAPYSIEDSVFTDLFDSVTTEADFIRIEDMGMSSSVFDRIRTYNKLSGLSHVKKAGVLSIPNSGTFIIPAGTTGSFTHTISSSSPFDFAPMVIVSPQRDFAFNSTCSNTQMGDLSINISFQEELQEALLVRFFFPQL
ncbi:glycosyl hydrolase family 28-related protein [Bacteroides nordii]|jgi:hypothetical protein|uniref:glycosyl hydrolase family 28-related protein n=1 Tax=Bacteroides nordii TaxID=291645 RepID=UPI002052CF1E|nr:glycosyl hydrolase family 28-related protein [Bacteroides nordii]DAZ20139.1 MAG TPA: endopolygalacturonase [Caudoviricetes sp.]